MTLGSNIQKIRKEAQMSQEDFAEMFHVSRQTISNWENSKSYPDLETIVKISDSFNISLDILLKEDLIMVKTFDNEIRSTRKYARALTAITAVFVVLVVGFVIYSGVYFNTKSRLEGNFAEQLKENNFYKNRDGYYSMDYANGIVYGVPNQSMPGLLEFSLQLSVHSALASSLARLMLQFYAGVRSCIFSIFRIFNVTFSVCFFFLVPPTPHWLAAMGGEI